MKEDNRVIAEFMGADFNEKGDFCYFKLPENKGYQIQSLKYDTSWDWIMAVCKKCYAVSDSPELEKLEKIISQAAGSYNIQATYNAIIAFLKFKEDGKVRDI